MPAKRKKRVADNVAPEVIELPARPSRPLPIIKVVGISGSGKSTLVRALRAAGYDARPVSQEHSKVSDLWQRFERTAYLIYLNASLENQQARRQDVTWSAAAHQEEIVRLAHAREHADLRIDTSGLTPSEVFYVAISYLTRRRVRRADHPLEPLPATGSAAKSPPPNIDS
jgi:RNase adaptor protein for sRNA GlmZ degradation